MERIFVTAALALAYVIGYVVVGPALHSFATRPDGLKVTTDYSTQALTVTTDSRYQTEQYTPLQPAEPVQEAAQL